MKCQQDDVASWLAVVGGIACFFAVTITASAANWVVLLPRDPTTWADLDSVRDDAQGLKHVRVSMSGNPSRPSNAGLPMRFVSKAIDCSKPFTVYDVDASGKIVANPQERPYAAILAPIKDGEMERALFNRVCLNRRGGD